MRSEQEMCSAITGFAERDARVLAAYLNGSRVNPNVAKDRDRDFDVVFVVTETASFLADRAWLACFGEVAVLQEPDRMDALLGRETDAAASYTFLVLFTDGNRIDLHLETEEAMRAHYGDDSLTEPLLDKTGVLRPLPPASDRGYWSARPDQAWYAFCCNEFWWCLNNVAKGLVRGQLPYALRMLHTIVLPELERMTEWRIASEHDFSITTGMWGKYFEKHLPPEEYAAYLRAYSEAEPGAVWRAIDCMSTLFRSQARLVAARLGFSYNEGEDWGTMEYLARMRSENGQGEP